MPLFRRKEHAKPASLNNDERSDRASLKSATSSQFGASVKSPRTPFGQNGMAESFIPELPIPKAPDPALDPAGYLRSIHAVRERSRLVLRKAQSNRLNHFDVDMSKFSETADYVVAIIKVCLQFVFVARRFNLILSQRDFAPDYASIPPHGRWQHFDVGGRPRVLQLLQSWPSSLDAQERTRRLLDLFLVSVLLDAGAGTRWSYKSKESGRMYSRSEGLAVASLEMFKSGMFSSNPSEPHQVDAAGLNNITVEALAKGMQVSETNPLAGLEGRAGLLIRLSRALQNTAYFGHGARPGNMLGTSLRSRSV